MIDIARLKILNESVNTKLHLKIGGVEAKNDVYECIALGLGSINAPMVKTEFGLIKFLQKIKETSHLNSFNNILSFFENK